MTRAEFERIVEGALASLPDEFRLRLENIAVFVEDEPDSELLEEMEIPEDEDLFGVFEGDNLLERSADFSVGGISGGPARVVLFQGPLERACASREELIEEIQDTVVHELGHYFGLEDEEMPI